MAEQDRQEIPTSDFLRRLFKTPDLEEFIYCHLEDMHVPPFHTYISDICITSGQVPEHVIKRAGIERTYGHQLFNGTRKPSRDKVIQLAFGLSLDVDAAQDLLKIARKSLLYPKIKRDAAILYCLGNKKDFYETQSVLESLDLTLLGGE